MSLDQQRLKVVSDGGGVTAQEGDAPTFPLTHLQQPRLSDLEEEVLVFLIFFIIDYIDLNIFAETEKTTGRLKKKTCEDEQRTGGGWCQRGGAAGGDCREKTKHAITECLKVN